VEAAAVTVTVTAAAVTATAVAAAGAAAEAALGFGGVVAAAVEAVQAAIGAGGMAFGSGATINNWVVITGSPSEPLCPQSPSSTGTSPSSDTITRCHRG
jgi:hypothetical protein